MSLTEADMTRALQARYGTRYGNGQRYAVAVQVRSHAGFDARRTADLIAVDLWPSKGFAVHGHEIKVSRSDWLRELKQPEKAAEFIPYCTYWWVVVPDRAMVKKDELPPGWGLMALDNATGRCLQVVRSAKRNDAKPLTATRQAALLRAVAITAYWAGHAEAS